jgi:hypothetical protein
MNAKAGEPRTKITKYSQAELLDLIRIWRKQTRPSSALPIGVIAGGERK